MSFVLLAWILLSSLAALVIGASIRFANGGAPRLEVEAAADEVDCPSVVAAEVAAVPAH
jgi:hypothetical protein